MPARESVTLSVTTEDDAPPLVRLIGRTLRDSARAGHAHEALSQSVGTVAVRSHDTPQAATVGFDGGNIAVTSGIPVSPDATIVVDLEARFAPVGEPTGDASLAAGTVVALTPPLCHWRDAAQTFWQATRDIPGVPDVLAVVADGPGGRDEAYFGDGSGEYLMAGPAEVLTGVFSGADDFLASLAAGVHVKGTLSQMSVITRAFWKVRFDV